MGTFPRTLRFLKAQRLRRHAGVLVALTSLFVAWLLWMGKGSVAVYVVSQEARLEVQRLPVSVQSPVDGQVTFADVRLGRVVEQGDGILKLDTRPLELQRTTLEITLRSGTLSLERLQAQLAAEQKARDAVAALADRTSKAGSARVSLDQKSLEFRQKESDIAEQLRDAAAISGLDALHSAAGAETQRAQLASTSAQAALDTSASTMSLRDRDARLAGFRYSIAQAEAEAAKLGAQIQGLDYEIERRTIHAPVSGTLVDVMPISAGATITSQQRLATILPEGIVRAVALFTPQGSLGRVRQGQQATLRMDNFPWTQFGTMGAVVEQVGREPRDGTVRVELSITRPNVAIPMEHGLTARCEVEVERVTPFKLLLRRMGNWVTAPPSAPTAPERPVAHARSL